ncbi:chaperonin 10-like protein [Fennellomyces sp. T-0311]|nr:chaperonin 10-like protein [Fennellomyces sp. T-0311]
MSSNPQSSISVPETMNALRLIKHGPPDQAFEYTHVKTPVITNPTDVLIKVKAAGINPSESMFRAGNLMSLKVPRTLGCDFSGVVVAKGSQVTEFEIGDAVYGCLNNMTNGPEGSYAEYTMASIAKGAIVKKPEHVSFEEAASLGGACLTAYHGIVMNGDYPKDGPKKILIAGASGGVGAYAVQIAKAIGAEAVGICSAKNVSFVSSLGADRVVDYTSKESMAQLEAENESYDLVFDCVGGKDYYKQLVPLLKPKGVFSTAVGPVKHIGSEKLGIVDWVSIIGKVAWLKFFAPRKYILFRVGAWEYMKTDIHTWLDSGLLKGLVRDSQIYDLKDGAKAHAFLDTQRAVGKVVLRM